MKKYLVIFLILTILFPASLIAVNITASTTADDVVYTESTIIGDAREVEGIRVDLNLHLMDHLFWDIGLTIGEEIEEEEDFDFDYNPPRHVSDPKPRFDLGFGFNSFGASSNTDLLDGDHRMFGMYEAVVDVASRTPDGEEHTENVRLADFYDYYPLNADIRIGDYYYDTYSNIDHELRKYGDLLKKIQAYFEKHFHFPVLDSDIQTITVKKRADGTVESVEANPANISDRIYLDTRSVVSDDAIYFTCVPRSDKKGVLPYESDTEFGLYRIPYEIVQRETPQAYDSDEYTDIRINETRLVLPMDSSREIDELTLSPDGSELYITSKLVSGDTAEVILTVLDCADLSVKQDSVLFECGAKDALILEYAGEDFMVYKYNWLTFAVIENSSGQWKTDFTVTDQSVTDFWSNQTYVTSAYGHGYDYDGERLAVMGCSNERGGSSDIAESYLSSFYISVYSEKGNLYTGKFTSSLDTGTHLRYNYMGKPTDRYKPSIRLP